MRQPQLRVQRPQPHEPRPQPPQQEPPSRQASPGRTRRQHLPGCKYYKGDAETDQQPANAALFDFCRREEERLEAERQPQSRLQLQRLPALTIRRQLQVQWGPTVSLPRPGEPPPSGRAPGHNVRLVEARHPDADADPAHRQPLEASDGAASAATHPMDYHRVGLQVGSKETVGWNFRRDRVPLEPVDVSPLREVPPDVPPVEVPPPPPAVSPPTSQRRARSPPGPSPPPAVSPPTSQRRARSPPTRASSRGRPPAPGRTRAAAPGRMPRPAGTRTTALRTARAHGATRGRPSPTANVPRRPAATSVPPRSTAAPRATPGPASPTPDDRPTPRHAPAKADITSATTRAADPEELFQQLAAAAQARRNADTAATGETEITREERPEMPPHKAPPYEEMSVADRELLGQAAAEGSDLWAAAQRAQQYQEMQDMEEMVLNLIGKKILKGILNKDNHSPNGRLRQRVIEQFSLSDESVEGGEHRVLGEGISLEETEIRTPINYDDYLDQEPADNEEKYSENLCERGSAEEAAVDYEDDFEDDDENEEETEGSGENEDIEGNQLNHGDTKGKSDAPAVAPQVVVDGQPLKDEKANNEMGEVPGLKPHQPLR